MQGTIIARVFTSNAVIPIRGASVAFYQTVGAERRLLAFRITNYDGLTAPVTVETPPLDSADISSEGKKPYATVDILAERTGFDPIRIQNAQVFTDIQSIQELRLVPSAEPSMQTYTITPQNL